MAYSTQTKKKIPWNKGKKGVQKVSLETRKKLSLKMMGNKRASGKKSEEHKLKISEARKGIGVGIKKSYCGEKHWNWKGGISNANKKIRMSQEYKLWRESVFKRDNYTCIWCGFTGYVEADHIKPFADYPELRFAIDNGRTLCKDCHKKTDTYGVRAWRK